ncbi:MAG: nuclear transport factor 2 family protein [Pseudohongiellaceae bacterium]|nr:nuclear transport factor 2 family protein [Pseudohongiellaceae bacterium]
MTPNNTVNDPSRTALIAQFKAFYSKGDNTNLEQLDRLYTQDIEFRDPIHTVHGILGLKQYMRKLYANSADIRFEYTEEHWGDHWASISWWMDYRHPKIAGGELVRVRGTTQIRFTDRIYFHEDFYDMGALLYAHLPIIGPVIKFINRRVGA